MIRQHFKIAIRNFFKHPIFSFINVFGLAIGMAAAMLLLLWVNNQFTVDKFHKNGASIYKIYVNQEINKDVYTNSFVPEPLFQLFKNKVPEINKITRVIETSKFLNYNDKEIQSGGMFVDQAFLEMFSFPLLKGNKSSALQEPNSIILTEKLARALFGDSEAIGKLVKAGSKEGFVVSGIIKDLPDGTQFKFDFLLPCQQATPAVNNLTSWQNTVPVFVQITSPVNINFLNKKLTEILKSQNPDFNKNEMFLYPLERLWLHAQFENGKPAGGLIDAVRLLITIAFIILLIACINFVNLSTARSSDRAKEVGVRKVMGVNRLSLIWQFINESIVLATIAGVLAFVIVIIALPAFNNLTEKNIQIQYYSIDFWIAFLGFILFTGLLAGSYPAFLLSSFKPVKVLKGIHQKKFSLFSPRKILVVAQFIFAVILINFTIMLQKQIRYIERRETGFNKENLIFHPFTPEIQKHYEVIKNDLMHSGAAQFVNTSNVPITRNGWPVSDWQWKEKTGTDKIDFELQTTSEDFINTNGVTLLQGRDINVFDFPEDTSACMLNEAAMKIIGFKNPVGQIIKQGNSSLTVVGVVKNFITGLPMQEMSPVVIRGSKQSGFLNIRLSKIYSPAKAEEIITGIIKKYNTNSLTEFQFSDKDYALKLRGIKLTAQLTYLFASIALFISCLGIFGLTLYVIANKTKEISIRKVFGAGTATITKLLTRDFVKLVVYAILIASPVSWFLMSSFLQPFYYRINLSLLILFESSLITLIITLVTISAQSINAAIRNPANNLREE